MSSALAEKVAFLMLTVIIGLVGWFGMRLDGHMMINAGLIQEHESRILLLEYGRDYLSENIN